MIIIKDAELASKVPASFIAESANSAMTEEQVKVLLRSYAPDINTYVIRNEHGDFEVKRLLLG